MRQIPSLDYIEFFTEALGDAPAAQDLYGRAHAASDSTAKIILHQTARLLSLADWMDEVAPARPALKVFFFVILAEAAAKLAFGFAGEGKSRRHVHRFFEELCVSPDRDRLGRAFRRIEGAPHPLLTTEEAVDILYDVRNDVAHRGQYFTVNLLEPGCVGTVFHHKSGGLQAEISVADLRAIVVRGASWRRPIRPQATPRRN